MFYKLPSYVISEELIGCDEWICHCRFHTYDYARHFVSACTRILGLEGTPEGVEDQGKLTRVAAVCISYKYKPVTFSIPLFLSVNLNQKFYQHIIFYQELLYLINPHDALFFSL